MTNLCERKAATTHTYKGGKSINQIEFKNLSISLKVLVIYGFIAFAIHASLFLLGFLAGVMT